MQYTAIIIIIFFGKMKLNPMICITLVFRRLLQLVQQHFVSIFPSNLDQYTEIALKFKDKYKDI